MIACTLKWLLPASRFTIVSVDLILRPPASAAERARAFLKRLLLKKVHRFILYFKDLGGYDRFYGIGPDRTTYIPFKVNDWDVLERRDAPLSEGDYVLCAGRTLRDTATFVEALRQVGCPGVLLQQNRKLLREHGTESWKGDLPENVKLIIDEGNQSKTFIEYISGARIVVIPRFKDDIAATGIGTYLLAMALNRCVIISEGPGANDTLTDQAVLVTPEDPASLAKHVRALWEDANLRAKLTARGREYASEVAGAERLNRDILHASIQSIREVGSEQDVQTTGLFSAAQLRK
jgi:Glycosyltransferase